MTLLRPLERPAVRRASAVALGILIMVFAIQTWRKAQRPDGNDLTSYLAAAQALAAGSSPYDVRTPFPYIYPLFLAFALIPLAALPYDAAILAWFAVSIGALGWLLAWIARREDPEGMARDALPIAAVVLILLTPVVQNNLLNGQVNFVLLACCIAALGAAPRRFEDRDGSHGFAAAAWWGAAIATKLLPLALAPWWLLRRRPLVVAGAIGISIALALAPILVAGRAALEWTLEYVQGFVGASLTSGPAGDPLRFSLYGVLEIFLPSVPWLPLVCALIVLGVLVYADARGRFASDDHLAYALYLAAIPLASPKSETHHLAFALPAAYVCALRVLRYRVGHADWRRRALFASAALFWIGSLTARLRGLCWFAALVLLLTAAAGLAERGPRVRPSAPNR